MKITRRDHGQENTPGEGAAVAAVAVPEQPPGRQRGSVPRVGVPLLQPAQARVTGAAKDLPPEPAGPGRRSGACWARVEAVGRSLALSCAMVITKARWVR